MNKSNKPTMFVLNVVVLILIPLFFPSILAVNPIFSVNETQNAFYDHLKLIELKMHLSSNLLETIVPQMIFFTNMSGNNDNPISPVGGPMNSSWPMSCHDLHHTSQSPYSTAHNHGAEIWRFQCDWVDGGPVIAQDGTIYFGDKSYPQYLYALYPNGTLKWRYQLLNIWVWSTPAVAEDGTVYVGDFEGNFYAIDSDGNLSWIYHIPDPGGNSIGSSPAIAPDGTIYFGAMMSGHNGYIYALNPDGTVKWRYPTDDYVETDPAIGNDGTIYIGSDDQYLYAMNPNGTLKWRFPAGGMVRSQPSIATDGTIYVSAEDKTTFALNPDGTVKWSFGYGCANSAIAIAADGTLYIPGIEMYALYPNGTVRWKFTFGPKEYVDRSCPAISADGTIYVGTNIGGTLGGDIVAVNPDGTEQWRQRIADEWVDSSPAIARDGTVYIGSASDNNGSSYGFLHAFGRGPLKVDAGGPYKGMPNVPVQFSCNVVGGETPYTYLWSFGDGNTSTTKNPTHSYSKIGLYNVTLLVTDSEGNSSSDTTTVFIDNPPNIPVITGSSTGHILHKYTYNFVTTDPENDAIEYWVEWGDGGNTGWIGPYLSGEAINLSYTWLGKGTYTIKCKARDSQGWESGWGTLQVTMPLSYEPPHFRFFNWLLEQFPHAFPILRQIINR